MRIIRSFVGISIFGAFGLLMLGYGIWEGAWIGIVAGLALVGVDALMYWLAQPVKRR
jgi:transketolase C-terminal domain/subunit